MTLWLGYGEVRLGFPQAAREGVHWSQLWEPALPGRHSKRALGACGYETAARAAVSQAATASGAPAPGRAVVRDRTGLTNASIHLGDIGQLRWEGGQLRWLRGSMAQSS